MAELWGFIKEILQWFVAPLAVVIWWVFKKQDVRIENLEKRANDLEKTIARIETELQYIGRDIKEIKDNIIRLVNNAKN